MVAPASQFSKGMTDRQRVLAILHYEPYDRLPLVQFGFWHETLQKWAQQGHITADQAAGWSFGNPIDSEINAKLGFDLDYHTLFGPAAALRPAFEPRVVKELADGRLHVLDVHGKVVLQRLGATSIPAEIAHTLTNRASWEEH